MLLPAKHLHSMCRCINYHKNKQTRQSRCCNNFFSWNSNSVGLFEMRVKCGSHGKFWLFLLNLWHFIYFWFRFKFMWFSSQIGGLSFQYWTTDSSPFLLFSENKSLEGKIFSAKKTRTIRIVRVLLENISMHDAYSHSLFVYKVETCQTWSR